MTTRSEATQAACPLDRRVGPADVWPVPKSGKRGLEPGPWMPGEEMPARDGMYLRRWEWSEDEAYSFFRRGVWYASEFWDSKSDHQDLPWRGGVRPNAKVSGAGTASAGLPGSAAGDSEERA